MSVLITGGTGFIGRHIARFLIKERREGIVLFDINPSTKLIDDIVGKIAIVRGDLANFSHVLNVVKDWRPQIVFHLGGMLSVPCDADPPAAFHANALGTFNVLESARLLDVSQVVFASTSGTYGLDLEEGSIVDDYSLQRPQMFYGATKVFAELMGQFYRRKYGLDFRGLRYPSIVGPGVKTPGAAQYTSWMIEETFKGKPFRVNVLPETRTPMMYFKDAARAAVELSSVAREKIRTVNYLVAGVKPVASAQELADVVRARLPEAEIRFEPDMELQKVLNKQLHPPDDRIATKEWGWHAKYDLEETVDDFIAEMKANPQRYA